MIETSPEVMVPPLRNVRAPAIWTKSWSPSTGGVTMTSPSIWSFDGFTSPTELTVPWTCAT